MKIYNKLLLLLFLCAAPLMVSAQILNIENQRLDKDTAHIWMGNIAFTFNIRQQQVQAVTLNWNMNLAYLSELHNYGFISNINYLKLQDRSLSDAYMHGRVNFFHRRDFSYEAFAQYQYDRVRNLDKRSLVGGGLRFKITQTGKLNMSVGPGIMYEEEEWLPKPPDPSNRLVVKRFIKSTNYLSLRIDPSPTTNFNTIFYYQARFNRFFSPRISGETNFSVKVTKYVSLTSRFSTQYDAIPVINIDKWIYTFTNGAAIRF